MSQEKYSLEQSKGATRNAQSSSFETFISVQESEYIIYRSRETAVGEYQTMHELRRDEMRVYISRCRPKFYLSSMIFVSNGIKVSVH